MRPLFSLIRREFAAYFLSPVAYVTLAVFLLVKQVNRVRAMVERPAPVGAPAMKECSYCASSIPIRASRCPQCTSQL